MTIIPGSERSPANLEKLVEGESLEVIVREKCSEVIVRENTYINFFGQKIKLNYTSSILTHSPNEIQIKFPFGTYVLGSYRNDKDGRRAFERYSLMLEEGCSLRLLEDWTAKFSRKKR